MPRSRLQGKHPRNPHAKMSEECLSACEGFASGGKVLLTQMAQITMREK